MGYFKIVHSSPAVCGAAQSGVGGDMSRQYSASATAGYGPWSSLDEAKVALESLYWDSDEECAAVPFGLKFAVSNGDRTELKEYTVMSTSGSLTVDGGDASVRETGMRIRVDGESLLF